MKFVVAVDCEGPACVVGEPGRTLTDSRDYAFARRQATREADAAARALFDRGATQVIVWDNHGGGLNLDYDLLDSRCDIALGRGGAERMSFVERGSAGLLLVGYHAREGTVDGVLAHTCSSVQYQSVSVNGREVGEIAVDAALAGERGVPVILVASDDKAVAEARADLPWIESVETKRGLGRNIALSLHPQRSVDAIYAAAGRAVERLAGMRPFTFASPVTLRLRYQRADAAEAASRAHAGWRRIDAFTVERSGERLTGLF
jgi:D-amino peptidase